MRGAARTLTHEHTAAGHTRGAACTRAADEVAEATRGLDVGRRRGSAAAHRQCRRAPRNCRAASAAPSAPTTRSRGAARKCCWPQRRSVGLFGERRGRRLAAVRDRAFRCGQPQVPMPKSAGVHRLQPQHRKRRKIRSPERAWDLTPGAGEARRRSRELRLRAPRNCQAATAAPSAPAAVAAAAAQRCGPGTALTGMRRGRRLAALGGRARPRHPLRPAASADTCAGRSPPPRAPRGSCQDDALNIRVQPAAVWRFAAPQLGNGSHTGV